MLNNLQYKELSIFTNNDLEPFIIWCVENEVSDITIQTDEDVFCHIHGKKHKVLNRRLRNSEIISLISYIYKGEGALSQLNAGEEINLAWTIKKHKEVYRFRVNIKSGQMDHQKGYSLTIRVIKNNIPKLDSLNLHNDILENIDLKQGLFLVTGSVGQGKSTLLASIIAHRLSLKESNLKISTYESPIEFVYDNIQKPTSIICQSEIGTHFESFSAGLKNSLRSANDAILVGEILDKESIENAILASMLGTFVYTTGHATGVSSSIKRLVNAFPVEERTTKILDILTSVKVIVSQMLIPSLDGKRIPVREYLIFTEEIIDFLYSSPLEYLSLNINKLLKEKNTHFIYDLTQKYERNLISKEEYLKVLKNFK